MADVTQQKIRWSLFAYFGILTILFHAGLEKAASGRPQAFVRYYMAGTTFKLLLHIGVILLFSIFNKTLAVDFIISFLIFYAVFTVFEMGINVRKFKR